MLLKKQAILNHLTTLPKKVLSLHNSEKVSEFVLHDLCAHECFDLQKAAYLVDNPDFDCLKGIAGFDAQEAFSADTIWETPELFIEHMQGAHFNQKVRSILKPSSKRSKQSDQEMTQMLGHYLGLPQPTYCSWAMKHDNQGILIYEAHNSELITPDLMTNGACLLGFCPVY